MRTNRLLLTAACLLLAFGTFGQTYPGLVLLAEGKCPEAHALLLKDAKKGKNRLMANYALAQLYTQNCGYQDAHKAIESAQAYFEEFRELDSKKKKAMKGLYGTDLRAKQAWQPNIVKAIKAAAAEKNDPKMLFKATQVFLLSVEERTAMQQQACEMILVQLRQGDACAMAPAVLADYGPVIKRTSPDFIVPIDSVIFRCFKKEKGEGWMDAFDGFKAAYPQSAYVRDIAMKPFMAICTAPDYHDFADFVKTYPQSVYVPYAQEYMDKLEPAAMEASIKAAATPKKAFELFQKYIAKELVAKNWEGALNKARALHPVLAENMLYKDLLAILDAPEEQLGKAPLPGKINTLFGEYVPVVSADGKTIFFCGQLRPDGKGGEDIFTATFENGEWSNVSVLKEISKALGNEAPLSLTADGNRLYVFDAGKIGYADKLIDGWGEVEMLAKPFNAAAWQADAVIGSDGRTMVFAMDKGVSPLDVDVFVSFKKENGEWSEPLNLGKDINSSGTDRTPFLHPDMRTLYFSSDGLGGLGGLDVFMTTRLDHTWTKWSKPVNVGKELNTPDSDWGYKISTDGQTAFFSVQKDKDNDLYSAKLPERLRPAPVKEIIGKIEGLTNKSSLSIRVIDKNTGNIVGDFQTNPQTGEYYLVVPRDVEPVIQILSKEVFVQDMEVKGGAGQVSQNISVVDLRAKEGAIDFQDLLFETGKHEIKDGFKKDLDKLAEYVKTVSMDIVIEGHTDNVGNAEANKSLSQRRADAVRTYLVDKGCNAARIKSIGFGVSQPIESNDTPEGKAKNRRVTLRFVRA